MTAKWDRIKELFEAALSLPEELRSSFLESQQDPATIMEEVRSLLSVYEEAPGFLEEAVARLPPESMKRYAIPSAGLQIGPWLLVCEIGRGGMGVVWEAHRADGSYNQRAAVKMLPASFLSQRDIARFREERQILARLDHPNITRLLDGGTLEDGSPYLVMEYVEGAAIDAWCDAHKLGVRDRLNLFLSACDAVEYAHRHLIIHRDLKPTNIMVAPEGSLKLLDFGIAKLIESPAARTSAGTRQFTPEFASPEQLRSEEVTTATDIFSLGVLLYILLTGQKPFTSPSGDPLQIMRAISEEEPPLPSVAAGDKGLKLRGEMDAIILQSLRKNPEERYASVRALADDIHAWLDGRPVIAQRLPALRRATKFIRRNKVTSAFVAALLVSILAGSGFSLWYAHDARRERMLAEMRFDQARRMADSILFELHDAIADLPGSTSARKLLVQRALEYLRDLEATGAEGDNALQLDLAFAYRRIGEVQGYGRNANLGDTAGAEASFAHARSILQNVVSRHPGDEQAEATLAEVDQRLGAIRWIQGDRNSRLELGHEAEAILLRLAQRKSDSPALLAEAYFVVAQNLYMAQEWKRSIPAWQKTIAAFNRMVAQVPKSESYQLHLAISHFQLAEVYCYLHNLTSAEQEYTQSKQIHSNLLQASPDNVSLRLALARDLRKLAEVSSATSRFREAIVQCNQADAILRNIVAADANNFEALSEYSNALLVSARAHRQVGKIDRAIELARQASADIHAALERGPEQLEFLSLYCSSLAATGDFLAGRASIHAGHASYSGADWHEAADAYEQAARISERIPQWVDVNHIAVVSTSELLRRSRECRNKFRVQ